MENVEIAARLREVADLLELQGANPFRVRAYREAARTIDGLGEPLADMVERGEELEELPAIGKDIAGYITEMVRTGRFRRLTELRREVPRALPELLRLEGIGAKKAMRLHRELGIRSVADLELALDQGRVEKLAGFGKRSAEKLRQAIRDFHRHRQRYRISEADQLVRPILDHLEDAPGLTDLGIAGSLRRRRETIGDIDLVAAAKDADAVMKHFAAYPGAARATRVGPTHTTIVLRSGPHVDLRVVPPDAFGAGLHHFTGSKAHNIELRRIAQAKGLKINEYGVFEGASAGAGASARERRRRGARGERRIGGEREEDVYRALGLPVIPVEMREGRGEVEAARRGKLPKLVDGRDIRGDLQSHSTWSDGRASIQEMARAAKSLGYAYLAVTDHSRSAAVAHGLDARRLEKQWKEIDAVNRRLDGITLLKGMEVDILADGSLDLPDEHLERLEVVIVAVHSRMSMPAARMTERVIRAISHPAVHILAHPTGRIINRREPYRIDMDAVLEAAAEHGVAIELNAQPDRLDVSDVHAMRARELGVRIAIDTDAHSVDDLRAMHYGVEQARRAWLEKKDVVNAMTLTQLRKWLARGRTRASPRRHAAD